MSQALTSDGDLRSFLVEHRKAFEILAEHEDDDIAELFGEFPLQLLEENEEEQ